MGWEPVRMALSAMIALGSIVVGALGAEGIMDALLVPVRLVDARLDDSAMVDEFCVIL
jgi:hypothetical protein